MKKLVLAKWDNELERHIGAEEEIQFCVAIKSKQAGRDEWVDMAFNVSEYGLERAYNQANHWLHKLRVQKPSVEFRQELIRVLKGDINFFHGFSDEDE